MAKTISLFGFASLASSEAVKEFLEVHTGEGTVSYVEVGQNEGSRAHAVVEFTTVEAAELIKGLAAERRLWYGNSYLKASDAKRRSPYSKLDDDLKLNFGCQISEDKFSVLWSQEKRFCETVFGPQKIHVLSVLCICRL